MQRIKKIGLFAIIGISLFGACKTQVAEPVGAQTNALLLAGEVGKSKSWKLTSYSIKKGSATESTQTIPGCTVDNIYTFYNNADQKYEEREGVSKCDAVDPDIIESGTWTLTLDGKVFNVGVNDTFSDNGFFSPDNIYLSTDKTTWVRYNPVYPAKVVTLTSAKMVLEFYNKVSRPADIVKYTATFVAE